MGLGSPFERPGNTVYTNVAEDALPKRVVEIRDQSLLRRLRKEAAHAPLRHSIGMAERIGETSRKVHLDVQPRSRIRRCRERRSVQQSYSLPAANPLQKTDQDTAEAKLESTCLIGRQVSERRKSQSWLHDGHGHRAPQRDQVLFETPAFVVDLRQDIIESLRIPASRAAVAKPRIQIAPLDHNNGAFSALTGPLNIAIQIIVEARLDGESIVRESQPETRFHKNLKMQRRESAQQMHTPLPSCGRSTDNLQCFSEAHELYFNVRYMCRPASDST